MNVWKVDEKEKKIRIEWTCDKERKEEGKEKRERESARIREWGRERKRKNL